MRSAPPFFFTVRATASNSTSDYTVIDNVVSNNDPNLALFVTANWNPNGSGGVYDNHSLGVFYIGSPTNKWAIYHDDKSAYTLNASYNVWVRETTQPGTFIWRANASNSAGDYTVIDNAATNGNPDAIILVTHNWNPGGVGNTYDNHALEVFDIGSPTDKWAIYHQDMSGYTLNASYNVYATTANGTTKFVQHACAAACSGDFITINSAASNGKRALSSSPRRTGTPAGAVAIYDNSLPGRLLCHRLSPMGDLSPGHSGVHRQLVVQRHDSPGGRVTTERTAPSPTRRRGARHATGRAWR